MCETAAVAKRNEGAPRKKHSDSPRPVSLRQLAEHLGLSPTTLSLVLNDSPAASSIPQGTKDRIFEAARGLNYRPHFVARSLRTQRSHTLGVLVPEISGGYTAEVLGGIEERLLQAGYFYIVACHRHDSDLLEEYPRLFLERRVDGIIAVDTRWVDRVSVPAVSVSGHQDIEGVTNIILNHDKAAQLALGHLFELGHCRIAFIKGQVFSSDTQVRWESIQQAAQNLQIEIRPSLTVELEGDSPSSEPGYVATRKLLESRDRFTALFAFNDISAIGAIRALRESGLNTPDDVSVVGFDDVDAAAFNNPGLTTIRQPLRQMGQLAAETVLNRIDSRQQAPLPKSISVEPELIVRRSTA